MNELILDAKCPFCVDTVARGRIFLDSISCPDSLK